MSRRGNQAAMTDVLRLPGQTWLAGLGVAVMIALGLPTASMAANYTWSGGSGSREAAWSDGANWLGGVAPNSGASISTLSFPELSGSNSTTNNLSGISVERLAINNTHGFRVNGNGFSLGSGGLSLSAESTPPNFSTVLAAPLTLTADQTWNISNSGEPGPAGIPDDVELPGSLSGAVANLAIDFHGDIDLAFGSLLEETHSDYEIGDTTISGSEARVALAEGKSFYKSYVHLPDGLNGADGHSITVKNVNLEGDGPTGPLTAEEANVGLSGSGIGAVTARDHSGLSLDGEVTEVHLDSSSDLEFGLQAPGSSSNEDNEITSAGTIDLGESQLIISTFHTEQNQCPAPNVGESHTLISTTGSIVGTFGNAPAGSVVLSDECLEAVGAELNVERIYPFRISYSTSGSPQTVTATAMPAVPTLYPSLSEAEQLPTLQGSAVAGQPLNVTHADWANRPTSYSDQWERCNSTGGECNAIADATDTTYVLSAADIGSTIRVQESASNSEGTSQPLLSAPSGLVTGSAPSSGGGSVSGAASGGGSNGPVVGTTLTATISTAQIKAFLLSTLAVPAKSRHIQGLLKHGGLTEAVKSLEAGTLVIDWWEVQQGAKLARKAKPVLMATGKLAFASAGSGKLTIRLTSSGKQLLKHAKRVVALTEQASFTARASTSTFAVAKVMLRR